MTASVSEIEDGQLLRYQYIIYSNPLVKNTTHSRTAVRWDGAGVHVWDARGICATAFGQKTVSFQLK